MSYPHISLTMFYSMLICIYRKEKHIRHSLRNIMKRKDEKNCEKCGAIINIWRYDGTESLCDLRCYINNVQARLEETYKDSKTAEPKVELREGSKNWKIISTVYGSHSVHSFVERETGDIFKPASWKAPAKHPRGNIHDADNGRSALSAYGIKYLR